MHTIQLIAGSEETIRSLTGQLETFLAKEDTRIIGHALEQETSPDLTGDLLILSSQLTLEELSGLTAIPDRMPRIIGRRTVNFGALDAIVALPAGTTVLLVNDRETTCRESIQVLRSLGLDHITYLPFYPDARMPKPLPDVAITPGEPKYVPEDIDRIVDIGPRIFDFTTIAKVLTALDQLEKTTATFSEMYLKKIIEMAKGLAESHAETKALKEDLEKVLDGLREGLMAFSPDGRITLINDNLRRLFKLPRHELRPLRLKEVIRNEKLRRYLVDESQTHALVLTLEGEDLLVQKIKSSDHRQTVVSFKSEQQRFDFFDPKEKEIIRKGFIAKYHFDDIVGKSRRLCEAKRIANKLATAEITLLIEGESGTGKELFASAIHNASTRKDGPFLAVNFSSLPDDLIESELFGYAEGAFTGAKKGGKIGLFEQANGGTLFLDEIGDTSLKVQTRLLRVLEEREIMAVGGSEIRPVDVRIVAATNKKLEALVTAGHFREDLYYRLKMGYIHLPPLRQREGDLPLLVEDLVFKSTVKEVGISDEVIETLTSYAWPGNVRELKNTVTYMLAVTDGPLLTTKHLPQGDYFSRASEHKPEGPLLDQSELYLLRSMAKLTRSGERPSRARLSALSYEEGRNLTVNQVRSILDRLEEKDLIVKRRGRFGTMLTEKGLGTIG